MWVVQKPIQRGTGKLTMHAYMRATSASTTTHSFTLNNNSEGQPCPRCVYVGMIYSYTTASILTGPHPEIVVRLDMFEHACKNGFVPQILNRNDWDMSVAGDIDINDHIIKSPVSAGCGTQPASVMHPGVHWRGIPPHRRQAKTCPHLPFWRPTPRAISPQVEPASMHPA